MRTRLRHGLSVAAVTIACTLMGTFSAFAANVDGEVDPINHSTISGWAVDRDNPDTSAEVALYLYVDGSTEPKELAIVTADQYRKDSTVNPVNEGHSFFYNVDWDKQSGSTFVVEAYVLSGGEQIRISGSPQYSKADAAAQKAAEDVKAASSGPAGGPASANSNTTAAPAGGHKGAYLGQFTSTAYCGCNICSGGSGLTYSGTVPKENHTISADINRFPIGTKLMIGDIVYTVEDIGSGVVGNVVDLYFDSHQKALNYGTKTVDVYAVE